MTSYLRRVLFDYDEVFRPMQNNMSMPFNGTTADRPL